MARFIAERRSGTLISFFKTGIDAKAAAKTLHQLKEAYVVQICRQAASAFCSSGDDDPSGCLQFFNNAVSKLFRCCFQRAYFFY